MNSDTIIHSEGKFQDLIKYAGDSIIITDSTYHITLVNESAGRLLNYTAEEFQEMKIYELMTADDQKSFAAKVKIVDTVGGSLHERKLVRKDGSLVATEVNVRPIQGDGYIAIIRDITERKEAEIRFRESEERYKSIIKVSNTGAWEYHADTEFVWCSPEYFYMLGRKQADYDMSGEMNLKQVWTELLHPEDREKAIKSFDDYLINGSVGTYESYFRMLHSNGSWTWIWSRGQTLRDQEGKLTNLTVGTHIDITERKNAEAIIKDQAEVFSAIIENAHESIWLVSPELKVLQFNNTAKERIKKNRGIDIYVGANLKDFLYLGPETVFMSTFNKALAGHYADVESSQLNLQGEIFWLRTRMYPVHDSRKELIGIAILTENITERKAMEAERLKIINEMLQRNRDLEQFAYIVSHNLRAPVANIIGITDYMMSIEMEADEKEEMNNGLKKSVLHLDEVIKDLSTILQMKREISEKKEKVKFSEILNNVQLSIETLINNEQAVFKSDFSAVGEIVTLKSYLHSIFYNLISNSIKYRRPDAAPVIEIGSTVVGNRIEVTYKDNGLGIDLERKGDQVFGLYKRFHTHTEGKGLGLYMVKTQVETLGGTISIKSKINEGTEFKIEFEVEKNSN